MGQVSSAAHVWSFLWIALVYLGAASLLTLFIYKLVEVYDLFRRPDNLFPAQGRFDKLLYFAAMWLIPLAIGAGFYRVQVRQKAVPGIVRISWVVMGACGLVVLFGKVSLIQLLSLLSLRGWPLH